MSKFDPPSDPFGDEVHCHICDAVMVQSSDGEWECLQYHEEDLVSQKDYVRKGVCPVCDSNRIDEPEPDIDNSPVEVKVLCTCRACHAQWIEFYDFDRYEMVGTK